MSEPRFRQHERDQLWLLPPSVDEWLPEGHVAFFVIELVSQLDLSAFLEGYRTTPDRGRPAYHPEVMVGVLLYAAVTGVISSRQIAKLLVVDVGFRVVAANEQPDHSTLSRFRKRHDGLMEGLFAQLVNLGGQAGVIEPSLMALDGTTMAANASRRRNVSEEKLRHWWRRWSATVDVNDAADDAAEAQSPPPKPVVEMFKRASRAAWIAEHLNDLVNDLNDDTAVRDDADADGGDDGGVGGVSDRTDGNSGGGASGGERRVNVVDPDSAVMRRKGGGWLQGYNVQAAATAGGFVVAADVSACPVDAPSLAPMVTRANEAVKAATGQPASVAAADAGYWSSETIDEINADDELPDVLVPPGRKLPTEPPDPLGEPDVAAHEAAVAAHEAELAAERGRRTAVVARVVAGELTLAQAAVELGLSISQVHVMVQQARRDGLENAATTPKRQRPKQPRGPTPARRSQHEMETRLAKPAGRSVYRQRQGIIEPVFGDIKTNKRITRFLRRGLDAVRGDTFWMFAGHNITIMHNHAPTTG